MQQSDNPGQRKDSLQDNFFESRRCQDYSQERIRSVSCQSLRLQYKNWRIHRRAHVRPMLPIEWHHSKHCTSTIDICSECAVTGHRHTECRVSFKKCINCSGPHKTTAPQCPKRKQEAQNIRQKSTQNKVKEGNSYSSIVRNTTAAMPDSFFMSTSVLKITTVNAFIPGSFSTEMNKMLAGNNLPPMVFPDDPPSELFLTKTQQKSTVEDMETQPTETTTQTRETVVPRKIAEL